MGPLYFLSLKKVHIFGFRVDDIPTQCYYLIGENETLGLDVTGSHGPNTVISLVHHGLNTYGYGEKECLLHADNFAGIFYHHLFLFLSLFLCLSLSLSSFEIFRENISFLAFCLMLNNDVTISFQVKTRTNL